MVPGVYTTGSIESFYALDSEEVAGVFLAGCSAAFFNSYFNVSITSLLLHENITFCASMHKIIDMIYILFLQHQRQISNTNVKLVTPTSN